MTAVKKSLIKEEFIFEIHLEDFEKKVLQASHSKPVLIDF